jgi:transposase
MSRHFRPWKIDQTQLLPSAFVDYVPADHPAQFVVALAREHLDLSEIVASYKSGLGQPPFDPRMMTGLLLYAYCSGLYSSRRRCQSNGGSSICSATAISRAAIYAARARHSAKAAERLCL